MPIEVPKAQRSGSGKENRVAVYLVFMTPVHHRSGIPMPTFSCLSDEFARNAQAHTKFLSFWCGHDGSFSKGQAEPVFSFDVHLTAFDGRRGNANENSCHLVLDWRSRITAWPSPEIGKPITAKARAMQRACFTAKNCDHDASVSVTCAPARGTMLS